MMQEHSSKNPFDLTEHMLIDQILQGDINQFELILKRYNQRFYRIGIAFLKNVQDTEDAMQSAYLKMFEKLSTFKGDSNFSLWATRIMINECKMLLRKRNKFSLSNFFKLRPEHHTDLTTVEQELIAKEIQKMFEKAVLQLPAKLRTVYMMRMIEGISNEETAEVLNLTPENTKVRLHRAKKHLKETLYQLTQDKAIFEYHLVHCTRFRSRVMTLIKRT